MDGKDVLERYGALKNEHRILDSGRHTEWYIEKELLFCHPGLIRDFAYRIAWKTASLRIDVVCGPVVGGAILAGHVAHVFGDLYRNYQVAHIPMPIFVDNREQPDGRSVRLLRRSFCELLPQKRVLLVDDVLTTGGTIRDVARLVTEAAGTVVGAAVLFNREGLGAAALNVPEFYSLYDVPISSYLFEKCPDIRCQNFGNRKRNVSC